MEASKFGLLLVLVCDDKDGLLCWVETLGSYRECLSGCRGVDCRGGVCGGDGDDRCAACSESGCRMLSGLQMVVLV